MAGFSPYARVDNAVARSLIEATVDTAGGGAAAAGTSSGNAAVGAVVGMVVGDAFGAPLEFVPAGGKTYNHRKQQRAAKKAAAAAAGKTRAATAKVRKAVPGVCLTTRTYTAPLNKFMLEEGQ